MSKKDRYGLFDFIKAYGNEESCQKYLAHQRWPDGFICSKCGAKRGYDLKRGHIQCAECRYQASLTAGTIMHRSHLTLTKWFLVIYLVTQDKLGNSVVQLSKYLNVTYKTDWYMLHRIRKAME